MGEKNLREPKNKTIIKIGIKLSKINWTNAGTGWRSYSFNNAGRGVSGYRLTRINVCWKLKGKKYALIIFLLGAVGKETW